MSVVSLVATALTVVVLGAAPQAPEKPSEPAEVPSATPLPLRGPDHETRQEGDPTARPGDARGYEVAPKPTAAQRARMVPRVIFYPVRMVFVAVFFPVDRLLKAGKGTAGAYVKRAFFWNRAGTLGWLPHASSLAGYGLMGGARVFHTNLAGNGERLQAKALYGGLVAQRYQVRLEADRFGGSRVWLDGRVRWESNPSLIFRGFGQPRAVTPDDVAMDPRQVDALTRYSQRRFLYYLRGGWRFGSPRRQVKTGAEVVYNNRQYGPRKRGEGRSIEDVYDTAQIPGFDRTVDVIRIDAVLGVDFVNNKGRPSRGFFFDALGGGAPPQRGAAFGHYAVETGVFINLFKDTRVLLLRAGLEALHGDEDRIPFSEMALLGGPYRLRGYHLDRFRDLRSLLATAEYRYPIHQLLSGHLFVDVGRVGRNYRDLVVAPIGDYHFGFGGGFTVRTLDKLFLKLTVAYGDDVQFMFSLDPLRAFHTRSKQL